MQVRLLGGSKHQKRIDVLKHEAQIIFPRPKLPKKWNPVEDISYLYDLDFEIYERRKMYKAKQVSATQVYVETKIAYVKKGSTIKPETFWKLAFPHEQYVDFGTIKDYHESEKS